MKRDKVLAIIAAHREQLQGLGVITCLNNDHGVFPKIDRCSGRTRIKERTLMDLTERRSY